MTVLIYILASIAGIALVVFVIGIFLPKERIGICQSIFEASPEVVYNIVTNNEEWAYRSDLEKLAIIEKNGDTEIWEETDKKGGVIRFETLEKKPYSYYSFKMESKVMTGRWTAAMEEVGNKNTLFTATEYIKMKNPFLKTLSYLFFDIGKYMENYQNDLRLKIESGLKG